MSERTSGVPPVIFSKTNMMTIWTKWLRSTSRVPSVPKKTEIVLAQPRDMGVLQFEMWATISWVPDTFVTYFVLHSLNQFTDETKQCMPVQINTWAKFCSTISFWYAVWFFELSWDKGCVSSGHLKYHAKKKLWQKKHNCQTIQISLVSSFGDFFMY